MKTLHFLSLLLFVSSSGAFWSEQSLSDEELTNNNNDIKIPSWPSWDMLPFAQTTITQWNVKRDSTRSRRLLTETGDEFAGDDMIVMVSFEDICK